jgi:hypothetical protein
LGDDRLCDFGALACRLLIADVHLRQHIGCTSQAAQDENEAARFTHSELLYAKPTEASAVIYSTQL